jgi:Fe2+ transport system protein FeoA
MQHILVMTLDQLDRGGSAIVVDVAGHDEPARVRVTARGFVPGALIQVIQAGDPLVVAVDRSRWAISRSEALLVQIIRS